VSDSILNTFDKRAAHTLNARPLQGCIYIPTTMAAQLEVPQSNATVRVHLIDTTTVMTIKSESFIKPVVKGHETISAPDVAFLIEHPSGKRVLFDLGCRKDYWNLPDVIKARLGDVIPSLRVDKDVSEILVENEVELESICSYSLKTSIHLTNVLTKDSFDHLVTFPLGSHGQCRPVPTVDRAGSRT
jgi:hypothetical protein